MLIEQQFAHFKNSEQTRVAALNNDRDQFRVHFDRQVDAAIVDPHGSYAELFNAYFQRADVAAHIREYLASVYDEIRAQGAG